MADAFTTITTFINSPPGQLVAGSVLAGIVWKFFERIEALLPDSTKFEVAVWLVGVKTTETIQGWPKTFLSVFHQVFGEKHPSWRGLRNSILASFAMYVLVSFVETAMRPAVIEVAQPTFIRLNSGALRVVAALFVEVAGCLVLAIAMAIPNYGALLTLRATLRWTLMHPNVQTLALFLSTVVSISYGLLVVGLLNFFVWGALLFVQLVPGPLPVLPSNFSWYRPDMTFWTFARQAITSSAWADTILATFPLLLGTLWMILYVFSGFLVKAARRFDIGFQWFNRKFDIEKKPLQSIGLVAGALVALVYWAVAIVARVV